MMTHYVCLERDHKISTNDRNHRHKNFRLVGIYKWYSQNSSPHGVHISRQWPFQHTIFVADQCKSTHRQMCNSIKYPYPSQGWSLEIPMGRRVSKAIFFRESMKQNWKFQAVGGSKPEHHPWGVWIFYGTSQWKWT